MCDAGSIHMQVTPPHIHAHTCKQYKLVPDKSGDTAVPFSPHTNLPLTLMEDLLAVEKPALRNEQVMVVEL